jgi:hypothetical protein
MFFTGLPAAAVGYLVRRHTPDSSPTNRRARLGTKIGLIVSAAWVAMFVLFIALQTGP